jgi:hypothetical protein
MASGVHVASPEISPKCNGTIAAGFAPWAPPQVQLADDMALCFVLIESLNIKEILKGAPLSNLSA